MRIHIAARRELRSKAASVAQRLEAAGHRVVSRWLGSGGQGASIVDNARYALTDVAFAECVVLLTESPWQRNDVPGASERHVEFGYALRARKRLCVLGPRETGFCHLADVKCYRTVKDLIDGLR